jgi:hypothetical protein
MKKEDCAFTAANIGKGAIVNEEETPAAGDQGVGLQQQHPGFRAAPGMDSKDAALAALTAQSFFAQCPEAVGVITNEGVLAASNVRFERTVGPQTLVGKDFLVNCISKEDHGRFKIAMARAREVARGEAAPSKTDASDMVEWALTPTVRAVSSIAMGNTGDFPIWRRMDWTVTVLDDTR